MFLSLSYTPVISKQIEMVKDLMVPVKKWIKDCNSQKNSMLYGMKNIDKVNDSIPLISDEFSRIAIASLDKSFLDTHANESMVTEVDNMEIGETSSTPSSLCKETEDDSLNAVFLFG